MRCIRFHPGVALCKFLKWKILDFCFSASQTLCSQSDHKKGWYCRYFLATTIWLLLLFSCCYYSLANSTCLLLLFVVTAIWLLLLFVWCCYVFDVVICLLMLFTYCRSLIVATNFLAASISLLLIFFCCHYFLAANFLLLLFAY